MFFPPYLRQAAKIYVATSYSVVWQGKVEISKQQQLLYEFVHKRSTDVWKTVTNSACGPLYYRKTPLISTYVFSGLATEQVLIWGAILTLGGMIRRSEKSCKEGVCFIERFPLTTRCLVLVPASMHILPGYRGTYIWGVCTFWALQPSSATLLEKNPARNVGRLWNLAGIFLKHWRIVQT